MMVLDMGSEAGHFPTAVHAVGRSTIPASWEYCTRILDKLSTLCLQTHTSCLVQLLMHIVSFQARYSASVTQ